MEVDGEEHSAAVKEEALKADSVVVLLSQALQAQDRALLERCQLVAHPVFAFPIVQALMMGLTA